MSISAKRPPRFVLRPDPDGCGAGADRPTSSAMRSAAACLLFLACLAAAGFARAGEVEFVRVWPGWREAESFDRIGEYFVRGEGTASPLFLRTDPAVRAGYYFLVRVKCAAPVAGAKFELSVVHPDAPEPRVFSFPAALPRRETVFHLGLTGAAWPGGKKASPVAWKLALLAADGRPLAEHQSYLWAKPAK
jgi:hypothetical protein